MKFPAIHQVVFAASAAAQAYNISVADYPQGALNATAWSLIYTTPLYIFGNFAGSVLRNVSVNQIYNQRSLASPSSGQAVIKPNVDTVYSRVVLDLSHNDVELTIPEINDGRYWNYPALDVYGNVVAEIGIVNGNTAGKYLIRRAVDSNSLPGYQAANYTAEKCSQYQGIVNMPTTYGTMLIRLLVKANTTEDLDQIHGYQNASGLTNVTRASSPGGQAPYLTTIAPNGTLLGIDTPRKLLDFAAKVIPYNLPSQQVEAYRVSSVLTQSGIYNGAYHAPVGLNLTQASVIANSSITASTVDPLHIRNQGNEWLLQREEYQGTYGEHYAMRAYIAFAGYQQQRVAQTLYPGYKVLGFTSQFSLQPNTSVLLDFSGKPQLKAAGFWSYTVYGPDQYLIPNDLNRFEIGDRSYNLTYRAGGLVYGPDADSATDGPFQVLIQPIETPPPANWTGNWLPGSSDFSFILRWYVPEPAMTDGSYVYPKVSIIESIV